MTILLSNVTADNYTAVARKINELFFFPFGGWV